MARVFLFCLVTSTILFHISGRLDICVSKPSLFLLSIILYLLGVFVAKPLVDDHWDLRTAKALGAKLPPPVNLGLVKGLKKTKENFETGYPGGFSDFHYWRKFKLTL